MATDRRFSHDLARASTTIVDVLVDHYFVER